MRTQLASHPQPGRALPGLPAALRTASSSAHSVGKVAFNPRGLECCVTAARADKGGVAFSKWSDAHAAHVRDILSVHKCEAFLKVYF